MKTNMQFTVIQIHPSCIVLAELKFSITHSFSLPFHSRTWSSDSLYCPYQSITASDFLRPLAYFFTPKCICFSLFLHSELNSVYNVLLIDSPYKKILLDQNTVATKIIHYLSMIRIAIQSSNYLMRSLNKVEIRRSYLTYSQILSTGHLSMIFVIVWIPVSTLNYMMRPLSKAETRRSC